MRCFSFLLLISNWSPYDFYSFKFLKVCFMGQHGIYLGDCFMWDWTQCASAVLDDPFYQCQLDTIDWWSYLVQPYTYWFSAGWICPLPIEGWRSSSSLCLSEKGFVFPPLLKDNFSAWNSRLLFLSTLQTFHSTLFLLAWFLVGRSI